MDAFWTPFLVITPIYIFYYIALIVFDLKSKPKDEAENTNVERFDMIDDKPDDVSIPDESPQVIDDDGDDEKQHENTNTHHEEKTEIPENTEVQSGEDYEKHDQGDNPQTDTSTPEENHEEDTTPVDDGQQNEIREEKTDDTSETEQTSEDPVTSYHNQAEFTAPSMSGAMYHDELAALLLENKENAIEKEITRDNPEGK